VKRTVIEPGGKVYQQKGAWMRLDRHELGRLGNWAAHKRLEVGLTLEDKNLLVKLQEVAADLRQADAPE
jgi:hypothetical protein